jgi:hypothetical protein
MIADMIKNEKHLSLLCPGLSQPIRKSKSLGGMRGVSSSIANLMLDLHHPTQLLHDPCLEFIMKFELFRLVSYQEIRNIQKNQKIR